VRPVGEHGKQCSGSHKQDQGCPALQARARDAQHTRLCAPEVCRHGWGCQGRLRSQGGLPASPRDDVAGFLQFGSLLWALWPQDERTTLNEACHPRARRWWLHVATNKSYS
jgi:hypothetical protein